VGGGYYYFSSAQINIFELKYIPSRALKLPHFKTKETGIEGASGVGLNDPIQSMGGWVRKG